MPSDPKYLSELKQYARLQQLDAAAFQALAADLGNESDRGAIILIATFLEDCLELRLLEQMPTLQSDKIAKEATFNHKGPISAYADKTLIAYALGIIDAAARRDIDIIRHIRNACAHCRTPLTLGMPVLANAVKAAVGPEVLAVRKDHNARSLRAAFILHCSALSHYVLTGERTNPGEIFSGAKPNPAPPS